MPPVVFGAVAAGGLAAATGATIFGLSVAASAFAIAGLNLALGLVTQALGRQEGADFSVEARDRSLSVRGTSVSRSLAFGETSIGGSLCLFEPTGASNQNLHVVEAHADHPCDAILDWYVNNELVGNRDAIGNVTDGRFAGHLRLRPLLGAFDQAADSKLVAAVSTWTEDHKGGGVCATASRLKWSADVWPNGFTGLRARLRGMPLYDPRDTGSTIVSSSAASPAVFATDAPHGFAVGGQVWIKNHLGAVITRTAGTERFTGKWHQVASVPGASSFTVIDEDGNPVAFTTGGTGGTATAMAWSDNWALCVRAYLTHRWTFNAQDDEIDDSALIVAANICDEQVALTPEPVAAVLLSTAVTVDVAAAVLVLDNHMPFQTGDPVRVASTGSPPSPLVAGTVYYAIPDVNVQEAILRFADGDPISIQGLPILFGLTRGTVVTLGTQLATSRAKAEAGIPVALTDAGSGTITLIDAGDRLFLETNPGWKTGDVVDYTSTDTLPAGVPSQAYAIRQRDNFYQLATTLENARAGSAIVITDTGIGEHTATRVSQLRYTCSGVAKVDGDPFRALESMMTAAAGVVTYEAGLLKVFAGAATTATGAVVTAADMRDGDLNVEPFLPRAQVFNAARGTFVDPDAYYTQADLPPYMNETYRLEDDGERIFRDFDFAFTDDRTRGQRLLKIAVERARQGVTCVFPAKPRKFDTGVWDVEALTIEDFGWSGKEFRVMGWNEGADFGVDLILREEAAAVWDWNLGDETTIDLAPNTNLPSAGNVLAPEALDMQEELYRTRQGSGIKSRAVLSWDPSPDAFVQSGGDYQVEYRQSGEPEYKVQAPVRAPRAEIDDLEPAVYDFRVQARNVFRVPSGYVSLTKEIVGLPAAPSDLTGLTLYAAGGTAGLRWDRHPDLDVREGGNIRFRHSPLLSGATWQGSTSIGDPVDGFQTGVSFPLKPGTYLARVFDAGGTPSPGVASVSTKQAALTAFATLGTVIEHPLFLGAQSGVAGVDSVLKLSGNTLIDDWADFDAVAHFDTEGGIATTGTYGFSAGLDLGSVKRVRLTAHLKALVVNALDAIDDRSGMIDDWEDFDGVEAGSADALVEVRLTDDDPAGSPVWGDWQRLDAAEVEARGIDPRCRLISDDPAYNIEVSELTLTAEEVA